MMVRKIDRAARAIRRALDAKLKDIGLYAGQDALILHLAAGPSRCGDAAKALSVKPPTLTKMAKRLFVLVSARRCSQDHRVIWLELTSEGHALVSKIKAIHEEVERGVESKIENRLSFIAGLNALA